MYASFDFVRRIVAETSTSFQSVPVVLFPLAGSAIDLWFVTGQYYDGGTVAITDYLSCSRASIGYAETSSGSLTQFASNVLRITDLGLLVEDAKTNLLTESQDFSSGTGWTSIEVSVATSGTAPDGTSSQIVKPSVNTSIHYIGTSSNIAISSNTIYTLTVYAKASGYDWLMLDMLEPGIADHWAAFNVNTGVTGTVDPEITASIRAMGGGWYRCRATMTTSVTQTTIGIVTGINDIDSSTLRSYAGDGTSGILMWGRQLEESFATSYIPTGATSASRAADVITCIGNLVTDINSATGSIVARTNNGESTSFAANIVDSNGTNVLGFDATNHGLTSITATLATANTANRVSTDKVGTAWDATGRSLVLNGGTVATDATAQTPSATLHVGSNASSNFIFAYLERLTIWTSKLGSSTLQGFTS